MKLDVGLEGWDELDRQFRKFDARTTVRLMRSAIGKAMNPIRREMRAMLRSAHRSKNITRSLRIRTRVLGGRRGGEVVATLGTGRRTFYGMFLQFGTRFMEKDSQWFTRGIESGQSKTFKTFKEGLWANIKRELAKR